MVGYLKNTSDKDVVFMYSLDYPRQEWSVPANGVIMVPESVADHAISHVNASLEKATEADYISKRALGAVEAPTDPGHNEAIRVVSEDLDTMSWNKVRRIGREYGIQTFGKTRDELTAEIRSVRGDS